MDAHYICIMIIGSILSATSKSRLSVDTIRGATPSSMISTFLNSPNKNGIASTMTGLQIIPSPRDARAALESSASQIARLQSNPEQPTARAASEAYQTEASARTQITPHDRVKASQNVNMMA
jgi:hypothetical protein